MSVIQEQIEKLSKNLSKLDINDKKLTGNINSILSYVKLLEEVDTSGVEPTNSVVNKKNSLREDVKNDDKAISREELLSYSKQKIIQDQIAISNIM